MAKPIPQVGGAVVTTFSPGLRVRKGDVISGGQQADDGWIVLQDHNLPQRPYLRGESNDFVHYSLGPSVSGSGEAVDTSAQKIARGQM